MDVLLYSHQKQFIVASLWLGVTSGSRAFNFDSALCLSVQTGRLNCSDVTIYKLRSSAPLAYLLPSLRVPRSSSWIDCISADVVAWLLPSVLRCVDSYISRCCDSIYSLASRKIIQSRPPRKCSVRDEAYTPRAPFRFCSGTRLISNTLSNSYSFKVGLLSWLA